MSASFSGQHLVSATSGGRPRACKPSGWTKVRKQMILCLGTNICCLHYAFFMLRSSDSVQSKEAAGASFSLWGVASSLADTVKKNTAEITVGLTETNWRAELEAFSKGVREEEHQLRKETVKRVEVAKEHLPKDVRHISDSCAHALISHDAGVILCHVLQCEQCRSYHHLNACLEQRLSSCLHINRMPDSQKDLFVAVHVMHKHRGSQCNAMGLEYRC